MDLKKIARELEALGEEALSHSEYFRNNPIIHDWALRVKVYADWADRLFGTARAVRSADKVLVEVPELPTIRRESGETAPSEAKSEQKAGPKASLAAE